MNNRIIGSFGESVAKEFLIRKGYSVITTNYRKKFGEIDLIAKDQDSAIVIVEVKTMIAGYGGLGPEDQLSAGKLKKIQRISQFFINENPAMIDDIAGWRIDVVAVWLERNRGASWVARVRHYKNI